MPMISVSVENFDIKKADIQKKITTRFPDQPYTSHRNRLSETILNEVIIQRRSGKVSLFFFPQEIYAVSVSSLIECAKALDQFFKWAKDEEHTNIAMVMLDKGDIAQASGIITPLVAVLTYILGVVFGRLCFLSQVILGVAILAGLMVYYFRSDLTFKLLKCRYNKKWT